MALGFARFGASQSLGGARRRAADRIIEAVRAHPFMVAGTASACTVLMGAVPRAFVKIGAEGVYCACVPHAGLGIALKCDSGSSEAAEISIAGVLAALPVWSENEQGALADLAARPLLNRRKTEVGVLRRGPALAELSIQF